MNSNTADVVVIGAGIVGLATAREVQQRWPDVRVVVVETENTVGAHQSGHNSGVLHSGAYYQPGSEKALLCRSGKAAMEAFCDQYSVPWDRCGKVIVATDPGELESMERIANRAHENGVVVERLDTDGLRELEPHAAGIAALHVPETGIVNYRVVCQRMAELVRQADGGIRFDFCVREIKLSGEAVSLTSDSGEIIQCDRVINCGGLQSDRIFRLAGGRSEVRIVPFRGEYYELSEPSQTLCRNLIYPVPDPQFPFLGVHFTRMIDGGVECGPNAVLAFSRKGYRWRNINMKDLAETLSFPGFRALATQYWRAGLGEMHRSVSKRAFVEALRKLIPSLTGRDLVVGRSGVRAQAVTAEGKLADDFLFEATPRAIHVLNAPSPAATASIAIARRIVDRMEESATA